LIPQYFLDLGVIVWARVGHRVGSQPVHQTAQALSKGLGVVAREITADSGNRHGRGLPGRALRKILGRRHSANHRGKQASKQWQTLHWVILLPRNGRSGTISRPRAACSPTKEGFVTDVIPRSPTESQVQMTELVLPQHTNALGTCFGGTILSWIDIAAGICAGRHARRPAVTVAFDDVHFITPVASARSAVAFEHRGGSSALPRGRTTPLGSAAEEGAPATLVFTAPVALRT